MSKKSSFVIFLCSLLSVGCTDADVSQLNSFGHRSKVTLYSEGTVIREWESTGKVSSERGNGFFFMDKKTKRLVRVSGTVVIEEIVIKDSY